MDRALGPLLDDGIGIAQRAGTAIMDVYSGGAFETTHKADDSPLTAADLAAHRTIVAALDARSPRYPVLSEESRAIPFAERATWDRYWLVDPLDGTKEFIARNDQFTVNMALIERGTPVLGVVHAPALGSTFWAARGCGAFRRLAGGPVERIAVADYRGTTLQVVASRSHAGPFLPRFLAALGEHELVSIGSSLKLCLIADGSAHLYPRFGPTSEWDIAAADAIVREAGGAVTDLDGAALRYNKPEILNPHFIAAGAPPFPWRPILDSLQASENG